MYNFITATFVGKWSKQSKHVARSRFVSQNKANVMAVGHVALQTAASKCSKWGFCAQPMNTAVVFGQGLQKHHYLHGSLTGVF